MKHPQLAPVASRSRRYTRPYQGQSKEVPAQLAEGLVEAVDEGGEFPERRLSVLIAALDLSPKGSHGDENLALLVRQLALAAYHGVELGRDTFQQVIERTELRFEPALERSEIEVGSRCAGPRGDH